MIEFRIRLTKKKHIQGQSEIKHDPYDLGSDQIYSSKEIEKTLLQADSTHDSSSIAEVAVLVGHI